jgi:hypothetical protein
MSKPKFSYDVEIPGRGKFEVGSDVELTDQQAFQYALQNMPPRTAMQEFGRSAGIAARGVAPVAAGAALGAPFGPPGVLAGTLALPAAEFTTQAANVFLPEKYQIPSPAGAVENLLTRLGLPQAETTGERMFQAGASALASTGGQIATLPAITKTATTELGRKVAEVLSQAPGRQIAAAAPTAAVAQGVGEQYGPLAGAGAGLATGTAFGVGARPRVGPTAEDLAAKSTQLFNKAKEAGVMFNAPRFSEKMTSVMRQLRDEGYEPGGAYPKLDIAFSRLTNTESPKDFTGLANARKAIRAAQASNDGQERAFATILKDKFDDYVANAPESDIVGTNTKTGAALWKQARGEYSKLMKADVFETMLENAQLDKSKFTASGAENSMAQQLRQLAKNDKKMRLFTQAEQAEIKAAAKGTTPQNLLKFFGRFAPTGPVSGLFAGGATMYEPTIGIPVAIGASAARAGATAMRRQSVERLADTMRLGGVPPKTIPVPAITGGRGLLAPQVPLDVTSEQLKQIYGQ